MSMHQFFKQIISIKYKILAKVLKEILAFGKEVGHTAVPWHMSVKGPTPLF